MKKKKADAAAKVFPCMRTGTGKCENEGGNCCDCKYRARYESRKDEGKTKKGLL